MTYHILGVMSGSSLDALDLAMVRFTVEDTEVTSWELVAAEAIPLSEPWKARLLKAPERMEDYFNVHVGFGKLIGEACAVCIRDCGVKADAICSHGHTLLHRPGEGYTVQIGHPAHIAEVTGAPVVSDVRSRDIAAGGQGAPLAPIVEKYCFPGYNYYLNLGGIANLSHFQADGNIVAWDICPCNQLLNFVSAQAGRSYDAGGSLARSGSVRAELLEALKQPLPLPVLTASSLDNTWVRSQYFSLLESDLSPADKLATLTEYIAYSVATQILSQSDDQRQRKLLVTGGGAHNDFLIERIRLAIDPVEVVLPAARIIDFKEAILMALCGLLRLLGKPNAFASVTGATHDTVNGVLTLPERQS